MSIKRVLWAVCAVALIAFGGLAAWRLGWIGAPAAQIASARPQVGGDFTLVDQNGRTVDQSVLRGKWSAVFFGFTYCPDICPATLTTLNQAGDLLGPQAKDLRVVFISVDPARDTPEQLKAYLEGAEMPEGTLGLTGTPEQVNAAVRAYRVVARKVGEGEGYTMEHSTAVYLMDPQGRFSRVLAYGLTPEQTADLIRAAMRDG